MKAPSTQRFAVFCCSVLPAIAILGLPARSVAQCEVQELIAADAAADDTIGWAVAAHGDRMVVGAPNDDRPGFIQSGAAEVFRFNGSIWSPESKLTGSQSESYDYFGLSVAISGDVVLVGALEGCCGATYVFRFNGSTWFEEQRLTASDALPRDEFGRSVSVSGDVALVGAWQADCVAGVDCGSAYVYRYTGSTWVEEQKLTASDAGEGDAFGVSVAISGDVAVVGAHYQARFPGDYNQGAVYVYRFNGSTWVEEQQLVAWDTAESLAFGTDVSVYDNVLVAGAPLYHCWPVVFCGAAYIYRFNGLTWAEEQILLASDPVAYEQFAQSVSADKNVILVGSPFKRCSAGLSCGGVEVYRFDGNSWSHGHTLVARNSAPLDQFGSAVSTSGDVGVIGARTVDCAAGRDCGAAYVFALGPDCNENGQADFCDIRDGGIPDVDQDGVPDECETIEAKLDIRPGACPNRLNTRSRGVLPVAVVGSETFDVTQIDAESLVLRRADGVGGSVRPLSNRHGPRVKIKDVSTPFSGPLCDCHELRGDGIDDLGMKFSTRKLVRSLELAGLSPGASVPLTLSGTLRDGTPFEASDCILITGGSRNGEADAADGWPTSSESGWPTSSEVGESIPRSLRRSQD